MNSPLPKPTVPTSAAQPPATGPTVQPAAPIQQAKPAAPVAPVPVKAPDTQVAPPKAPAATVPATAPTAPVNPTAMPPQSLSALSSMTSTQIPKNNLTAIPKDPSAMVPPAPSIPGVAPAQSSGIAAQPQPPAVPGKPGGAVPPAGGKKPQFAKVEKPIAKYAVIGVVILLVLGLVGGAISFFMGKSNNSVSVKTPTTTGGANSGREVVSGEEKTIEYWGLWEPTEVMTEVISDFEKANPGIKVSYKKQSHLNYRERLQTAISGGNGPDVFRFHASWTPMLLGELKPIPNSVISAAEFKSTYYPVAVQQLQANGQFVGIPTMYDGLALLYNKEMFETAGLAVPTDWAAVKEAANKLVIKNSSGAISRGGIALGNATNVDNFSDILGLLMLQNGATLTQSNSQEVADALSFYTSFQATDEVWSSELPNSTVAFARGEVAMIIVPSWRIHEILAQNPDLNFGVSTAPIIEDQLTWGTFWAEGINSKSKNQEASAIFLKYLSQKETLEKFYDAASQVRAFGEIYPRMDMAADLADNEYVAPYLADAPYAKGWYMSSFTHDNGINDQIIKYYEDAVTAIAVDGKKATSVQTTLDAGVSQVLRQYGVSGALSR